MTTTTTTLSTMQITLMMRYQVSKHSWRSTLAVVDAGVRVPLKLLVVVFDLVDNRCDENSQVENYYDDHHHQKNYLLCYLGLLLMQVVVQPGHQVLLVYRAVL